MVKNIDYESRRRQVLATTIDTYIKEAEAVASGDIASYFDLSSATIRNIFAGLEEEGYLTHPYTSGGRIPTDKGYRYYVDSLLSQLQLLDEEKQVVINEYKQEISRLEDVLEKTSQVISAITRYTGIVSSLEWEDKIFLKGISFILEEPEFQDSAAIKLLIKMIEEKQRLLNIINRDCQGKVKVYIGEELSLPEMRSCSLVVSSYNVNKRPIGRLAVLGPVRMEYSHIIPAVQYVSQVLSEMLEDI